ncbi:hypothetical protein ASF79_01920 [Agreia sp. Leaf335]|nr:hypothetical protein ASF79_01920 [Agreia sp. Leaf335]
MATWATIDKLLSEGRTSAEIRWRFETHTVSILDLKRADGALHDLRVARVRPRRRRDTER